MVRWLTHVLHGNISDSSWWQLCLAPVNSIVLEAHAVCSPVPNERTVLDEGFASPLVAAIQKS